jgi:hypothetical protein
MRNIVSKRVMQCLKENIILKSRRYFHTFNFRPNLKWELRDIILFTEKI